MEDKEIETARRKDLKEYYDEVHTCKMCGKRYGSDINEKLHFCPDCEVKLKGKKDQKKKLSLSSETKHLNKEITTK